jgi:hypothetical protein
MSPAQIMSALAAHDARIVVEGNRVRVIFRPGHPPPAELVQAARQHKDVLRRMATGAIPNPLPDYIIAGFSQLKVCLPLWIMTVGRWASIIETAHCVATKHGATALRLGWRDVDLFGVHPKAPGTRHDCRGLAFSVDQVDRIVSLDAHVASIEKPNGSILRFYRRRNDTGAVLAWSLCEAAQWNTNEYSDAPGFKAAGGRFQDAARDKRRIEQYPVWGGSQRRVESGKPG